MGKLVFASGLARQNGYTYLVLLMVVAVTMISSSVVSRVTSQLHQRAMEEELLFRGEQYRRAIKSFYETGTPRRYPGSIDDLLQDPRFVSIHHLRKPWGDPMAGPEGEWGMIVNASGDIVGVASKSNKSPIKKSGFPASLSHFKDAESYEDWLFVYDPQNLILNKNDVFQ
ncbi:type II secretion system GspH family protein [Marinobacter nauticus]|uniref:type II secretion system GspH family protein n=1 Tax=Marinobacter nauticus TaxID=2743 RepID=UPI001A8DE6BA|nr:type II secretion system GspH family protein [Marinobacter nauticus]MBN8241244.1 type II secretion system protein [Marinobacter nauticus]